jgi:hypothetical protein
MAKAPRPGRVKTRLCPPCSPAEAAAIAEACLADTLEAVAGCRADRKVVALDGPPGPWLPPGFEVIAQRGSSFDRRLAHAWGDLAEGRGCGLQIGMDTPQITSELLDTQLALLTGSGAGDAPCPRWVGAVPPIPGPGSAGFGGPTRAVLGRGSPFGAVPVPRRAVLGPATDGGWWLIGLPRTDPRWVFHGVPMSTASTGAAQARRLLDLGFEVLTGPELRDIDYIDDLLRVTASIPDSRTARVAKQILDWPDGALVTGVSA